MRKTFIILSIVLLFAAVSCASTKGDTSYQNSMTISVSGTGTIALEADMVTFSVNISETEETTALAQQATNKKISEVLAILREFKIEDKYISTTALNFNSEYYWDSMTGRQIKTGENVSQTVYVTMMELDKFASLVDSLGSRISGISFYNVTFNSSERLKAADQARTLAYEDAKNKAQIYATAAGLTLGNPISISDGYSSYGARNYSDEAIPMPKMEATAAASYKTEAPTGQLSVSTTVQIVFELK